MSPLRSSTIATDKVLADKMMVSRNEASFLQGKYEYMRSQSPGRLSSPARFRAESPSRAIMTTSYSHLPPMPPQVPVDPNLSPSRYNPHHSFVAERKISRSPVREYIERRSRSPILDMQDRRSHSPVRIHE